MKLSFIGNMNSFPFSYAIQLKRMGHDVNFFVTAARTDLLKRPEYFYPDIGYPYPSWIHDIHGIVKVPLMQYAYPSIFFPRLIKCLNDADAVFFNNNWHAISPFLRKDIVRVNLFSGSDLDTTANPDSVKSRSKVVRIHAIMRPLLLPFRSYLYAKWMANHRLGVSLAHIVDYFPKGVNLEGDNLLKMLKQKGTYSRIELRGIDCDQFQYLPYPHNSQLQVLCGVRAEWKNYRSTMSSYNKGNDIIIRGLSMFIHSDRPDVKIYIVNKGKDVQASKDLSKELGIDSCIEWFEPVALSMLTDMYRKADICIDQCGTHWVGGFGYFGMLHGRPLIANARPDVFNRITGPSPICHATTAEQVASWLSILYRERKKRLEIGLDSRKYILSNFDLSKVMNTYLALIRDYSKKIQMY